MDLAPRAFIVDMIEELKCIVKTTILSVDDEVNGSTSTSSCDVVVELAFFDGD